MTQEKFSTALQAAYHVADSVENRNLAHRIESSLSGHATLYERVKLFHRLYGVPIGDDIEGVQALDVSRREFRLNLILEEFLELVKASGFKLEVNLDMLCPDSINNADVTDSLVLSNCKGVVANIPEMLDGLGDIKYVCEGFGIEMGAVMPLIDQEIHAANMTKLGADGNPIYNYCQREDCEYKGTQICDDSRHRPNPFAGKHKVLKGPNYTKAQISLVM